jgi:hypothetical protein
LVFLFSASISFAQNGTVDTSVTKANSSHFELVVRRNSDTLDCPDAQLLYGAFSAHSPREPDVNLYVSIRFARQSNAIVAKIDATGYRTGKRELRLTEQNCEAFFEPLAIYLALLIDPNSPLQPFDSTKNPENMLLGSKVEREEEPAFNEEPSTKLGPYAPTQPPTLRSDEPETTQSKRRVYVPTLPPTQSLVSSSNGPKLRLSTGPVAVFGLVPRTAFGIEGEIEASWHHASLRVKGSQLAETTISFGDGTIHGKTQMLRLTICGERALGRHAQFSLCAGSWLSKISVRTEEFATNGTSNPLLWAFGSSGQLRLFANAWWGGQLDLGWMIPVERHVFTIDGVAGEAFRTSRSAFTLSFGGWVEVW